MRFSGSQFLQILRIVLGSISAVSRVWSLILPEERLFRGMSVGSFSRTAAGNRAYISDCLEWKLRLSSFRGTGTQGT